MRYSRRSVLVLAAVAMVAACGGKDPEPYVRTTSAGSGNPELDAMIARAARRHEVPVDLVHRVVRRESSYNPAARNGPYMGLMQIHPQTARGMGYQGAPGGLLDAATNLEFGVKYLRGAWIVSDGSRDDAVKWYSRGYYYEAKRRGLLEETGLRG